MIKSMEKRWNVCSVPAISILSIVEEYKWEWKGRIIMVSTYEEGLMVK